MISKQIYTVYKHTSPIGKSYIGQTKDYERRCLTHRYTASRCIAFAAAIKKHRWANFKHEILYEGLTLDEANSLEEWEIFRQGTMSPNGYNLVHGGLNKETSEETRNKISASLKGRIAHNKGIKRTEEVKQKIRLKLLGRKDSQEVCLKKSECKKGRPSGMLGKKHSEQTKKKIADAGKGRSPTDETLIKKCKKVSIEGVIFNSFTMAWKQLKISPCTLRKKIISPDHNGWFYI